MKYAIGLLQNELNNELIYHSQALSFVNGASHGAKANLLNQTTEAFRVSLNKADERIPQLTKAIELLTENKWIDVSIEPEFGGEYNVVYDLEDGGELVVSTMDYDKTTKLWMDTRGANNPIHTVKSWKELPKI